MTGKDSNKLSINAVICLYIIATLLFLVYLIWVSPNKFISDERDFMPNIKVLAQYGFSFDFLKNIKGQSPGPLYQYIYYPISFVTALTPKSVRYINFLFTLGNIWLLYLLVKQDLKKHALLIALLIMAIPMTWVIAGMAFTEMPSIFFCMLALLLLRKSINTDSSSSLALSALAGLAAGTAIIGRSPFLMLIPAALLLYALPGKRMQTTVFLIASAIFPGLVFYAWNGLVPPDVQGIQSGYQPAYLLLCIMYFAIGTLIIYPGLFAIKKIHYYIAVAIIVLSFIIDAFVVKAGFMPMNGVLTAKVIPPAIFALYPYMFPAVIVGCSYIFVVGLLKHIMANKHDVWKLFLLGISLLIMFTTVKSAAHFNSKYVIQAYPFFLLYLAGDIKVNKGLLIRVVIGTIVGIMSLNSYYVIHASQNY